MNRQHLIRIYREAAEAIDERNRLSCCQVADSSFEASELYSKTMLNGLTSPFTDQSVKERQSIRVLLLLLMAEWVRTDYRGNKRHGR